MKKILLISGVIVLGLLLIFGVYKLISYKEPIPNKVELNKLNAVLNRTEMSYADTIVSIGLDALDIDSITVFIRPLNMASTKDAFGDIMLKAYIIGKNNQYVIYTNKFSRKELIDVLSHELIHLSQYYHEEIVIVDKTVVWRGSIFDHSRVEYENRPWERDAELKKFKVIDYINLKLYGK